MTLSLRKNQTIRHNMLPLIGFCLFFYFSYHLILGERSYLKLMSLERKITKASETYTDLHKKRESLERKVVSLRPGSLDLDLLEERARIMLGYVHPDEHIILVQ